MDFLNLRTSARVAAGLILTTAWVAWGAILSPGDLAKQHANIDTSAGCAKCHPAGSGEQLSQGLCLDCHTELKSEVAADRGYHGRIPEAQRACEECHHEHQGKDVKLIDWGNAGQKGFEHQRTGWPLAGKHAPLTCAKCHDKRFIVEPFIVTLMKKYPERVTFLGLQKGCDSCHFDEHRGQIEAKCESCHRETGWKPASNFSHAKTSFPLKGQHAKVTCEKCHGSEKDTETAGDVFPKPVSMTFARYAPVAHGTCLDCHADFHKGAFGPKCENCHVVEGWRVIKNQRDVAFHEKTKFPLRGAHVTAGCPACHGPFPGEPQKFKNLPLTCEGCHPDAHEGQMGKLANEAKTPPCERCHTVQVFKPSSFDLKDHAQTKYPLVGGHVAVACSDCHKLDPKVLALVAPATRAMLHRHRRPEAFSALVFAIKGATDRCETCHNDPHGGAFKAKDGQLKSCTACHQIAAWNKLLFDHNRDSSYALTGKHAQAPCAGCHPSEPGHTRAEARYKPVDATCAKCHSDIHVGQFADKAGVTRCEKCHTPEDWKALLFKHEPPFTQYLLDGEHAKVKCTSCHQPVQVADGVKTVKYRPLGQTCEECHADFHKGAFEGFEP